MVNRLKHYMSLNNVSRREMSEIIGMTYNAFNKCLAENRGFNSTYIEKLLLKFPDLDARWLLTGEGTPENVIPIYKVATELLDDQIVREKLTEIISKKLQISQ